MASSRDIVKAVVRATILVLISQLTEISVEELVPQMLPTIIIAKDNSFLRNAILQVHVTSGEDNDANNAIMRCTQCNVGLIVCLVYLSPIVVDLSYCLFA